MLKKNIIKIFKDIKLGKKVSDNEMSDSIGLETLTVRPFDQLKIFQNILEKLQSSIITHHSGDYPPQYAETIATVRKNYHHSRDYPPQ